MWLRQVELQAKANPTGAPERLDPKREALDGFGYKGWYMVGPGLDVENDENG